MNFIDISRSYDKNLTKKKKSMNENWSKLVKIYNKKIVIIYLLKLFLLKTIYIGKDENISNHRYIGISILRIYRRYIGGYFKLKNFKNSWKCKENLIII